MIRITKIVIGPFSQILTMDNLPKFGALSDEILEVIPNGWIVIENGTLNKILSEGDYQTWIQNQDTDLKSIVIKQPLVLTPGLIDCHTHICYAGDRANEYAMKLAGKGYLEIAKIGGGIMSTVKATRSATIEDLVLLTNKRAKKIILNGITTCEVKSGYGLSYESELKILKAIQLTNKKKGIPDLIPTCLAAHIKPPEFATHKDYLDMVVNELLPAIKRENLCNRIDIFIEEDAFNSEIAKEYLLRAKALEFEITVHADQFSIGGSQVAAEVGALSADHLEVSNGKEFEALKSQNVIASVLPGASIGLGIPFAPARKILDQGLSLVIASDWNPGTAPMGDLLTEAAILGAYEKLSMTETIAAITCRAAQALNLQDRGILKSGMRADMCAFPCETYTEILYSQGSLKPIYVWKNGDLIIS